MEDEEDTLREAYKDWRKLSPERRKELRGKAFRFVGSALGEGLRQLPKQILYHSPVLGIVLLLGSINSKEQNIQQLTPPTSSWSYSVHS